MADALRQDLDWIREHTRLAQRWEKRKKAVAPLLRGDELEDGDASKREQPSEREPQQQSGQQQAHDNGRDELLQAHTASGAMFMASSM